MRTCHNKVTYGEITKEQLWRRLGIEKKTSKAKRRMKKRTKRKRPKTPLERLTKQLEKDFL